MNFWKMNGAGNDFIIIEDITDEVPDSAWSDIAKTVCERHMSIGADGMMVVKKPSPHVAADYKMLFFNSDGSMGEMCGNGARCICRYGYERGLAGETQTIETTAGIVIGKRIDSRMYKIRLNDPTTIIRDKVAHIDGKDYAYSYVELGNPGLPHAVVPIANLKDFPEHDLFVLGEKMRHYSDFPKGANVNFYEVVGENHVYERTFERGVEDFTYACGTGTGSMVVILTLAGIVSGKNVQVDMTGGTLVVDIDFSDDGTVQNLFLTGPTNIVAKGEITDETLILP